MIKIENEEVLGWEHVILGLRNPMNSWDKSDSGICFKEIACHTCKNDRNHCKTNMDEENFVIGLNDYNLMMKLRNAGTDHRKFMRMITVYADITAPLYWWSEYDTYKVGTVANSCSKMHKLLEKPFSTTDFSFDKLNGYRNKVEQFRPEIDEEMVAKEVFVSLSYLGEKCKDYSVSQYGRVKHQLKDSYRLISGSVHEDGYIFVTIGGIQRPIHRLVAYVFHNEEYKEGLVVNHKDGNKMNNFAENLEWVTQSENIKHSVVNNLQPKTYNTYKGKFNEKQRNEIKELWDSGKMSKRKIAEKYGVSHTCINNIINDKYSYYEYLNSYNDIAIPLVDSLNELRDMYMRENDEEKKKNIWYTILMLLPESYNQKRTVMLNYEVLANMYKSRKNHKLDEWRALCSWIETLPYHELITGEENND